MESNELNSEIRTIRIELEAIKSELETNVLKTGDNLESKQLQNGLTKKIIYSITDLLTEIKGKSNDSLLIFQKAFKFLNEIEQVEFIAKNVMEAIKRGESPSKIFKNYIDIGLIDKPENAGDGTPDLKQELTEFWFNLNYKTLKSLGTLGSRLASKSLKKVPEFIKIKTHYSPLPPFLSFSCEMQDSASLDMLLELIQDSIKETNSIVARNKS